MATLFDSIGSGLPMAAALFAFAAPPANAQIPDTDLPAIAGQTSAARPLPPALEEAIALSHEALRQILNGDPSGYAALFADRSDITLGNPFGPFGQGRSAVLAALNNAASKYTDGSVVRVDRVAVYGGSKNFVLVEIEHDRARLGSSADLADFSARVTSVYELIGGSWKIVHRHADPITDPRPAGSMLAATAANSLVGTWRLVSFEDIEDGRTIRRFGENPVGQFIYTASGDVSIHIANPANPACIARSKKSGAGMKELAALPPCSAQQALALLDGSVTYWGKYTADMAAGIVTHHVVGDVSNGYGGTDQPRPFRLTGDRLVIGDGKNWRRVLERVVP